MSRTFRPIGLTGFLPSGNPSDHNHTKVSLENRKIKYSPIDTKALDFQSTWNGVLKQHMPKTKSSDCLNGLMNALMQEYADENEFDEALFKALENGLGLSVSVVNITTTRTVIVVDKLKWTEKDSNDWPHECAIAFATQVTSNGDLKIPKDFGCATSSRHDHSCVLIARRSKKGDGNGGYHSWNVRQNLATVELKRQRESIFMKKRASKRKRNGRVEPFERIETPIQKNHFGALWQIIAYTISDVWTCLARTGAGTQRSDGESLTYSPPACIPFALLACVIKGEKADKQASRYAYGNIEIPEVCGDSYSFNLLSYGTFDTAKSAESAAAAAAAYIKVLSFGVSMGSSIKERASSIRKIHSMVGRQLHLSGRDITSSFELLRSPISTDKFGDAASQGEIWRGRLGISFQWGDAEDFLKFADIDFANLNPSLLLKCSSKMIHNPLVASSKSWRALKRIAKKDKKAIVNKVLIYAEYRNEEEILMLMHDLSETHKDLQPCEHDGDKLRELWVCFCALVRDTLLELARIDIVHPDIRPGYDFTSNILLGPNPDTQEKEMVLIDLDSLTFFEDWPIRDSLRYLNGDELNPYSFVWWQCFAVAVMWKRETRQSQGLADLRGQFYSSFETEMCSVDHVETLLNDVSGSDWFGDQALTDERVTTILNDVLLVNNDNRG